MKKSNDLHTFLRKHGAVRKFKRELKGRTAGYNSYKEALTVGKHTGSVIADAFIWSEPNGGADEGFWRELDRLYENQFERKG